LQQNARRRVGALTGPTDDQAKETILLLVAATVAPVVPLLLTMMPMEELLKKLLGILF
jgi:hypothetical protein